MPLAQRRRRRAQEENETNFQPTAGVGRLLEREQKWSSRVADARMSFVAKGLMVTRRSARTRQEECREEVRGGTFLTDSRTRPKMTLLMTCG